MAEIYHEDYYLRILFQKVKVKDIMKSPVVTVDQNAKFSEVLIKFIEHRIFYIPIIDNNERLVGLISYKYFYKTRSPRKKMNEDMEYRANMIIDGDCYYDKTILDSYILQNVMNRNPLSLHIDDSIAEAVRNMDQKNLGCIPIMGDDQKVQGILTHLEIIHFVAQSLSE